MSRGCWLVGLVALLAVALGIAFSEPPALPSPLLHAAYKGDSALVQALLPLEQQRQQQPGSGKSSSRAQDASFAAHVREQANAKDAWNNTALHWAARGGTPRSVEIAKHLLATGAEGAAQNNGGSTALHWAATCETPDVSRELIQLLVTPAHEGGGGCYVNTANSAGETPLHWAVDWVRPHAVQALLDAGADVRKVDRDGNSPLHKIKADCDESEDCTAIVRLLVAAGSDVGLANAFKRTPLQYFNQDKEGLRKKQQQGEEPQAPQIYEDREEAAAPSPARSAPSSQHSPPPPPPPGPISMSPEQIDRLQEQIEEFRQNLTDAGMLRKPEQPEQQH